MKLEWIPNSQLFVIIYSILVISTDSILLYLSEYRIDVYASLYILEYFILRALISPLPRKLDKKLRIIDITFFILFIIIVSYRVIMILAPSIIGG